ncbi:HlyD family efflux transporter periplasmic adaptor subunit [Psychromonas sp. KJ10-2]|uniref:HlyD family efflux transporter periplasmic adaptor subunit n=1 Tax=Psychromonas sp. KJ10-2 TaxID=3391822 RepID=UPI0039B49B1A
MIQPGEPIMKVLPVDEQLLIEARIKPKDVAFLAPGMTAKVKITAYDYTIYGDLEGRLEQISADTFEEDTAQGKEYYYQVLIHTDKNYLERNGEKLPIRPGMITQVDILGAKRTVLSYLLKPLIKATLY